MRRGAGRLRPGAVPWHLGIHRSLPDLADCLHLRASLPLATFVLLPERTGNRWPPWTISSPAGLQLAHLDDRSADPVYAPAGRHARRRTGAVHVDGSCRHRSPAGRRHPYAATADCRGHVKGHAAGNAEKSCRPDASVIVRLTSCRATGPRPCATKTNCRRSVSRSATIPAGANRYCSAAVGRGRRFDCAARRGGCKDSSTMESLRLPVCAGHGAEVEHGCGCATGLWP